MIIFMCKSYEHAIVITNRMLVQGDFLEQMEKVIALHPKSWQKTYWFFAEEKEYCVFYIPELIWLGN